jgi:hypothetical protein
MKTYVLIFIFMVVFATLDVSAQLTSTLSRGTTTQVTVERGDTVYFMHIPELVVRTPRRFRSAAEERQFWRLVGHVKRVYPYAKLAGAKLHELNEQYLLLTSDREKKAYSKKAEDELKAEFEGELRKLTITQGRILMRLVDRETGHTTYEIVKDFRGSVQAVFWQAVARVFGSNLKTSFDPTSGEDMIIERIINEIEQGWL